MRFDSGSERDSVIHMDEVRSETESNTSQVSRDNRYDPTILIA